MAPIQPVLTESPLAEFGRFVKQATWPGKLALLLVVAPPASPWIARIADMGPLWREESNWLDVGYTAFALISEYLVYVVAFYFWHGYAVKRLRRRLGTFLITSFVLANVFVVYLYFYMNPIKGVGFTTQAMKHLADNWKEIRRTLSVDETWQDWYLATTRLLLLLLWAYLVLFLNCTLTTFVILERKKQISKSQRDQRTEGGAATESSS